MRYSGNSIVVLCLLAGSCSRSADYYLQRGKALASAGKYEEAFINFNKAIQKNPKFGDAYYQLGLTDISRHLPVDAYRDLRDAMKLLPNDERVTASFGDLLIAIYNLDPAHPRQIYDDAVYLTGQILSRNPNSFDGNRFKGALALVDKNPAEAVEDFHKALNARPGDRQASLGLAEALVENNHEQEGIEVARGLIQRDETFAGAYDLLARHYVESGQPQDAEEILKLKVANNPRQADYVFQLAALYVSIKKPEMVAPTLQKLLDRPSAFPNARMQAGDFYNSLGNADEALRQYKFGVRAKPGNRGAYLSRIVQILSAQKRWPEVYEQVNLELKEQPDDDAAKLLRATVWLEEGRIENLQPAISELRAQLARKPANVAQLHFQLGSALARAGDREGFRNEMTAAAASDPQYLPPRYSLAETLRKEGETEDALRIAGEILRITPADQQARLLHATCLTAAERYTEARFELDHIRADFPGSAAPRFQLAVVDMYEGKYPQADAAFRQLRQEMPNGNPDALMGLVESYRRQNRLQEAIQLLQDELRHTPGAIQMRSELASLALASGSYDLAIDQYRQLETTSSAAADAENGLIQAYIAKGDYQTAIAMLNREKSIAPRSVPVALLLAEALDRAGRVSEAKAAYRRVLGAQSDNGPALNNLAFLMADTGDNLDDALNLAKRGLDSGHGGGVSVTYELAEPEDGSQSEFIQFEGSRPKPKDQIQKDLKLKNDLVDTLGWIYLKKKAYDSAAQCFQTALKNDPGNPVFHFHLGSVLAEKGNNEQAKLQLNAALKANPSPADSVKIKNLLSRL